MEALIPTPGGHVDVAEFDAATIAAAIYRNRMAFPDGSAFDVMTRADGTGQVVRTLAP